MKIVTVRDGGQDHTIMLDFNQQISNVLEKLNIVLNDNQLVMSLINHRVIDPSKTFIENEIDNNEILLIRGQDEN